MAMAVHRFPGPPRVILSGLEGNESLFEVLLAAMPSPEWPRPSSGHPVA
jgi:hypothetical protein